jgi:hypothetical protein
VLLGDEKVQPELGPLLVVGIDGAAAVASLALSSLDGGTCGAKAKSGVVDDSEAVVPVTSGSKRSLSRLIVSST